MSFSQSIQCYSLVFGGFWLVILLFKIAPKQPAQLFFSVPKHIKAVMLLMDKISVFDKLPSRISGSGTDHKFNVNEPILHVK